MRTLLLAASVCLAASAALAQTPAPAAPAAAGSFPALPPGPGRDVMVSVCSNCHNPELASTQAHDAAGWRDLLTEMQGNGANFTPAQADTIVGYLSSVFPKK